jgi:hypothetical protein
MELAQVWETRRARYLDIADLLYDVSAESADCQHDLQYKAMAIQRLLQHAGKVRQ